jgi:hypothetical protein
MVGEAQRQQFGMRYGRFVANGDATQASLARQLLDVVVASAYLPEPVRVAELAAAIDDLLLAHRGFNNFYRSPDRRADSTRSPVSKCPMQRERRTWRPWPKPF